MNELYADWLVDHGKAPATRKLLTTIHGLLRTKTPFDPSRFYQPQKVRRAA